MANGTITVTIDTNEFTYLDTVGNPHVVTNGQTFTIASTDLGDGAKYSLNAGQSVTCTDGTVLFMDSDPKHDFVIPTGDAASTDKHLGTWTFLDPVTGQKTRWRCISLDMDDADAPTVITTAIFEQEDDPNLRFTWSAVTCSFA